MSNKLIDELLAALEKKIDALSNHIDQQLKEHLIISTTMEVITFNPTTLYQATIIQVGGHMMLSPMEVKIFKVMEAQVTIIKNKSTNLLMKNYFMPY